MTFGGQLTFPVTGGTLEEPECDRWGSDQADGREYEKQGRKSQEKSTGSATTVLRNVPLNRHLTG